MIFHLLLGCLHKPVYQGNPFVAEFQVQEGISKVSMGSYLPAEWGEIEEVSCAPPTLISELRVDESGNRFLFLTIEDPHPGDGGEVECVLQTERAGERRIVGKITIVEDTMGR